MPAERTRFSSAWPVTSRVVTTVFSASSTTRGNAIRPKDASFAVAGSCLLRLSSVGPAAPLAFEHVTGSCIFCDIAGFRSGSSLFAENELAMFGSVEDGNALSGSGVIVPKAHRPTVFDLTPEEVSASFDLLREVRTSLERRHDPDGFNIGWNCYGAAGQSIPHAHMHVLLRFDDEPWAGRGIRWGLRQPDNRRADPFAPGRGRRDCDAPA
jgi:histidine triad (HIT) family protein